MKEEKKETPYVWFDAEFTSLELDQAKLLQVAVVITDARLNRLAPADQDLDLCIRLDSSDSVSPWVAEHLPDLVQRCQTNEAVSIQEADQQIAALLDRWCGPPAQSIGERPVLAGNSVHNDWFLMRKFLPEFTARLHYRLLDVSTLKTLWTNGSDRTAFDKENKALLNKYVPGIGELRAHDALFDVHASIAELAFYREQLKIG